MSSMSVQFVRCEQVLRELTLVTSPMIMRLIDISMH